MPKPIVTMTDSGDGETKVTVDLGGGHILTFETWNDVGTWRFLERYNGAKVRDFTNGGGHVEDRQTDPAHMPAGYEVHVQ